MRSQVIGIRYSMVIIVQHCDEIDIITMRLILRPIP